MNCLFCNLVNSEIPANVVYDDTEIMAFRDINPQAPTHVLVIPKKHIATINELDLGHEALIGRLILTAKKLAKMEGIDDNGYRLVFNVNRDGGQTVNHIHLHVLGGRKMTWPPG